MCLASFVVGLACRQAFDDSDFQHASFMFSAAFGRPDCLSPREVCVANAVRILMDTQLQPCDVKFQWFVGGSVICIVRSLVFGRASLIKLFDVARRLFGFCCEPRVGRHAHRRWYAPALSCVAACPGLPSKRHLAYNPPPHPSKESHNRCRQFSDSKLHGHFLWLPKCFGDHVVRSHCWRFL